MKPNTMALASLLSLSLVASLASAESHDEIAAAGQAQIETQGLVGPRNCAACASQLPILEIGRPPLPGEEGAGSRSCTLVNTRAEWDAYCVDNVIPDCPILDDGFFAQRTVVAVAIDTLTARPCEGSPDPLWKLDCVTPRAWEATVRVVLQRPGGWCRCSAMPQQLQRLFLASAVPKTLATECRTCEERHTLDCFGG